uniref:Chemokine interleukin-8-like domain-containing protein n=2 Tax=Anabas testudineus TaxID=64144 RepID=A0AAQ6ILJ7_ANATE
MSLRHNRSIYTEVRAFQFCQISAAQRRTVTMGPTMPLCTSSGLFFVCLTVLLVLPVQGQYEHTTSETPRLSGVHPNCCVTASKRYINETINSCYEQKEHTFPDCKIHAYIFITKTRQYCVHPKAKWLPEKLRELEEQGIYCQVL